MSSSDQRVAMLRITASAASGVRHPCSPDFGLRTRSCECWPPRQWIVRTTSRVASSTSAMMSVTRARRSCWRVRMVTPGCVPGGVEIVGKTGEVGRHDGGDQATALPPAAPGRPRRGAAPSPSSSRAARRSDDCRDRRRHSAVPRARLRIAPAAAPVRRCAVVRRGFPCTSVRPRPPPRSPSARRRAEARGRPRRRRAGRRR